MDLRTSSRTVAIKENEKIKFNIDGLIASHNSGKNSRPCHQIVISYKKKVFFLSVELLF
jgi:hypothetical protein